MVRCPLFLATVCICVYLFLIGHIILIQTFYIVNKEKENDLLISEQN